MAIEQDLEVVRKVFGSPPQSDRQVLLQCLFVDLPGQGVSSLSFDSKRYLTIEDEAMLTLSRDYETRQAQSVGKPLEVHEFVFDSRHPFVDAARQGLAQLRENGINTDDLSKTLEHLETM